MTAEAPTTRAAWRFSPNGFAAFFFLSLLCVYTLLRVVLFMKFGRDTPAGLGKVVLAFIIGFHRDIFVSLLWTVPVLFWVWIVPRKWFRAGWHRFLFLTGFFLFWAVGVFTTFAEYYFFEEFRSRFNTVAVDYLLYPHEVFVNIWDSYPVPAVVGACAAISLAWVLTARWLFSWMWDQLTPAGARFRHFLVMAVICGLLSQTLTLHGVHFSPDRTLNEIADNGAVAFFAAAWTRNLDYSANYKTLSGDEAYERVRKLVASPDSQFVEKGHTIRRKVAGDPSRPRLNVIILLEESFGSEFWGCLGRSETLTPEMDKLSIEEGMLFTNIYASGNRTVRGFEGVFSSFPPLPGDSILHRDRSENVETLARILKRDGYNTVFLYGGRGMFDGMKSYTTRNGWDRFIEHNPPFHDDFPHPNFATVWGVCDEEVYMRGIQEFRALNQQGKPFLGCIMTVSNHKPYTYPRGKIPEDPELPHPTREKAVNYSDWSLGQFFRAAKHEAFWTNTIFVVAADHGARVYGKQQIPIHSYEIPVVFLGPAVIHAPSRVPQLGCSLDVSPTILGLLGRPYETMFFGRDLLKDPPEDGRALLNHNRDIGMLAGDRMVVLGYPMTETFYGGDPKRTEMQPVANPSDADRELEKNAMAVYQVADDLYMNRRYRIDGEPVPRPEAPK
jgi:phosphoglycerol transferase MdoB-like AlkP superfamily enzyme